MTTEEPNMKPLIIFEEYEPRAKKRGWRVAERYVATMDKLGWPHTPATEGKA